MRISDKDSSSRIVCVPQNSFSTSLLPSLSGIYFRDCAIPFGVSASGDYAACAKAPTVYADISDSPEALQKDIHQAILEDNYVDDGAVRATTLRKDSKIYKTR